jgi:hypothetical protein
MTMLLDPKCGGNGWPFDTFLEFDTAHRLQQWTTIGVIRSWLSGKTLDRDFTFTGDENMTYMPARGPWFDTRKPHLVTLVRWQKGAQFVVRRPPLATKSWAIGASRAYASPGAAADQPGVQDGTSFFFFLQQWTTGAPFD